MAHMQAIKNDGPENVSILFKNGVYFSVFLNLKCSMYGIPTHIEHLGMFNSGAEQKKHFA